MFLWVSNEHNPDRFEIRGFALESTTPDAMERLDRSSLESFLINFKAVVIEDFDASANAVDTLRAIRKASDVPVLCLSSSTETTECVLALELGADDYVREPVDSRELVARLRTIIRRPQLANSAIESKRLIAEDIEVFVNERAALRVGELLPLTRVEFDLLRLLLQHHGSLVTREEISRTLFGAKTKIRHRSIDVHISSLRKKMGKRTDGGERIRTIHGSGYIYTNGVH